MIRKKISELLVIYGCGGHARSVANVAWHNKHESILFVDPNATKNELSLGYKVAAHFPTDSQFDVIIGVGNNQERAFIFNSLSAKNMRITTLISKDAYLGKEVKVK